MNELVQEWIDKAEGDYHSALRDYRARQAIQIMKKLRLILRKTLHIEG